MKNKVKISNLLANLPNKILLIFVNNITFFVIKLKFFLDIKQKLWYYKKVSYRGVAQLVEQRSPKPRAQGSSPCTPAKAA